MGRGASGHVWQLRLQLYCIFAVPITGIEVVVWTAKLVQQHHFTPLSVTSLILLVVSFLTLAVGHQSTEHLAHGAQRCVSQSYFFSKGMAIISTLELFELLIIVILKYGTTLLDDKKNYSDSNDVMWILVWDTTNLVACVFGAWLGRKYHTYLVSGAVLLGSHQHVSMAILDGGAGEQQEEASPRSGDTPPPPPPHPGVAMSP